MLQATAAEELLEIAEHMGRQRTPLFLKALNERRVVIANELIQQSAGPAPVYAAASLCCLLAVGLVTFTQRPAR